MIIDQEAAQERILYEQYVINWKQTMPVQKLLFPETLSFSPQDADTISHLLNDFLQLGFDIEAFGRNTFILNGLPSGLQTHNIQETMEQILETYKSNMLSLRLSRKNNLAHSLAKTLGVKKGQTLTHEEMQHIIQQLFSCQSPEISPSGKKICAIFSENEILQLFN